MKNTGEKAIINKLIAWADRKPDVRAVLLTSSRTKPDAKPDEFSDYDVIVVVKDIRPYLEDENWLEDYGKVLTVYRDPIRLEYGFERFCRVTHYQDYAKIDYTIWPVGLLQHILKMPELPDYLDDGYHVLLDKDNVTGNMKPPTYTAFIPHPPTAKEYRQTVEEFFSEAAYVAKSLRRDNIFAVKLNLDHVMKLQHLHRMLEWLMEIENGWQVKTGAYGKGLKNRTRPELWTELESTYCGAETEANWEALLKTIKLFRSVATEVGKRLGYCYPEDMDSRVVKYLQKVRDMK